MGLSSKQVSSSSGLDWKQTLLEAQDLELPKSPMMRKQQQQKTQQQTQQQSADQCLKCPRCDSTNTKFCYYNNYNKSQPRHFCRACKRHWTKGGTLRNVPVGGSRKNKRVKKTTSTTSNCTPSISTQTPLAMSDPKTPLGIIQPPSLLLQQNLMNNTRGLEGKDDFGTGIGNGMFTSSSLSLHQNNSMLFPFSTSGSFDTTTCSSSNVYYYGEEYKTMEEPTINSIVPNTKPWEMIPAATSGGMETSNYWNWENIDSLISTDLKDPWDDSDIKP